MDKWLIELREGVRNQMAARGHTQRDAATRMDIHQSQLNDWLHGRSTPSRQNETKLRKYAEGKI